jgi:uncharacterized protein YdcH (DUF465 family)
MKNNLLIGAIISFCVFGLFTLSSATPMEDEAVEAYKVIFQKKNACFNYDEVVKLNREIGTKENLKKLDSPEEQEQMKNLTQEYKDNMFEMLRSSFFDISELEIKNVITQGDIVTINYGRKGHPGFSGEVTLTKEDGVWKMIKDFIKGQ